MGLRVIGEYADLGPDGADGERTRGGGRTERGGGDGDHSGVDRSAAGEGGSGKENVALACCGDV